MSTMEAKADAPRVDAPVDLSTPSRAGLSHLLRNPDQWPKEFGPWDFRSEGTCAINLHFKQWGKNISNTFGPITGHTVFGSEYWKGKGYQCCEVTPTMVANAVDENYAHIP